MLCSEYCIAPQINPYFLAAVLAFYFWFITIFVPLLILITCIDKIETVMFGYNALLVLRPALERYVRWKLKMAKQQKSQYFAKRNNYRKKHHFSYKARKVMKTTSVKFNSRFIKILAFFKLFKKK